MSKASKLLKANEGSASTTVESIKTQFEYFLDDFENAVKGENGANDPPHPECKAILAIIKEMKKSVAKLSKVKSNDEVWVRSPIG